MITLTLFFFQDCFDYLGPLAIPYEFEDHLFTLCKKGLGILIEIALNLKITLGSIDILAIWSLPTHELGMSFSFFKSSFFQQCFVVFAVQVFISLVIVISSYFILLDTIINGIVYYFLFYCLLLVYRNTTDFGVLILHPEDLLNSFFTLLVFSDLEGISTYKIMSSTKRNSFTSLSIWMPFIEWLIDWFWCLIALARTSSTMFNSNGKSWHSCLLHNIRRKGFSFSLLSMILSLCLS